MLRNLIFGIGFSILVCTGVQADSPPVVRGQSYRAPVCPRWHGTWFERVIGQPVQAAPRPMQRTFGLPVGRTYYGDRYFGNFNNRFFGPQYGYF